MKYIKNFSLITVFMSILWVLPFTTASSHASAATFVPVDEVDLVVLDNAGFELGYSGTAPCPRGTIRVRRNTSQGKRIVNALIAGGIGAAIGGGLRGGRGALVGLGVGSGGYLVYRYVRDRRGHCVPRYVRG